MAVTLAQNALNAGFEAIEPVVGDKGDRRSGEAAAVDADGALSLQQLLAQSDGEGHVLLLDIARRGHVLQQRPGRHAGGVDQAEECVKIPLLQRLHLGFYPPVLVEEVDGSENRPVAGDLADFGDVPVERRLVHVVENAATAFISTGMAAYSSVRSAWSAPESMVHRV